MTIEGQAVVGQSTKDVERGRSTIEFPYLDLSNAIEVAQAVKQVGGTAADNAQLATKLNMAVDGGGFRQRLMTAKMFGLLDYNRGQVELQDIGIKAVDPQFERSARVEAFLRVPLYKALFDKLNGQTLPPAAAIERMIEQLGVAPKQKDKARQVFLRSSKQAGFFEISTDRLALPPGLPNGGDRTPPPSTPPGGNGGSGGSGVVGLDLDPLLIALLQKIPVQGQEWPKERRVRWFRTFAMNVSQVYDTEDDPVEMNIS